MIELRNPPQARKASWESDFDFDAEDADEQFSAEELELVEAQLVDDATAAKTIIELEKELEVLKGLERQAADVLASKVDTKWDQLSAILQSDDPIMLRENGRRRKMLIFTEHRDTLDYLVKKVGDLLGRVAVIEIHGGTRREDRLRAQEQFRQNPDVVILVATDAAGEGVNLQVANLMVNYDLPWNPNRIEQRFGRIHRIGQMEVCRLWNLVARNTREGEVFQRLFDKLEVERKALGGRVFDILGQTFEDKPLKDLLIEAIRHGEDPKVKAKLFEVVDGALDRKHIQDLYRRNTLTEDVFTPERLANVKEAMEIAEARKLQPFYLRRFLVEAIEGYGGALKEREKDRYEVRHVPAPIRQHDRTHGSRRPVLEKYERITFDRHLTRTPLGKPPADLVHPGHPLMAALIDITLKEKQPALLAGTVLIDELDLGTEPRLLFLIDHLIREGTRPEPASRRVCFLEMTQAGVTKDAGAAPHLSYRSPREDEQKVVAHALEDPWLKQDLTQLSVAWATQHLVPKHVDDVRGTRTRMVSKTLEAVHARLTREISYWSKKRNDFEAQLKEGKQPRMQPENAKKRVEELKARLASRTAELEASMNLASNPPTVLGCALVLPQGYVNAFFAKATGAPLQTLSTDDLEVRKIVELIAMKAVMDAERALGHTVKDVSAENVGWDVTAITQAGVDRFIEVKGRIHSADAVTVTTNEVLMGLNKGDRFILAVVLVDGERVLGPHYIRSPFTSEPDPGATSVSYHLGKLLSRAKKPHEA